MPRHILNKSVGGALLVSLMITTGVSRASADLADVIIGGGAAVILGCATGAINCNKNKKRSQTTTTRRSTVNSVQRQQNREVQSALNGFGWNAGTVDGVMGNRSRAAIRDYQGYMGYPQTGQLSDWERQNLVNGWRQYQSGAGGAYPRTMAAEGPRGLLNIGRDPNYAARYGDNAGPNYGANTPNYGTNNNGTVDPWANNGTQAAAAQPLNQVPRQQVPQAVIPDQPQQGGGQVIGNGGTVPKLKPLKPVGQPTVSAAARCELVDQTTRIQGGVVQASNMTDPNQALSEKFCEARGFAITQGGSLASQYAVSENEMTELCSQIAGGYSDVMSGLPSTDQAQVMPAVQSTATQLGLSDAATMGVYGQICLGIGYRLDDAEMALAGALTMMAAGQAPYGELIGHHLREGFGVPATPAAAVPWYVNAMDSLESGATPVFVPSTTTERVQVIRSALQVQNQRAGNNGQSLPRVVPVANTLPLLTPKD
nr:peptidoglycan-binding domain-containing protein [uncultured Ruegeria sp.]